MATSAMQESSILAGPRPIVPPGPVPPQVDKHFDFLEWSPDGESLLLGTSNLSSRTWAGSVWLYHADECKEALSPDGWKPSAKKCLVGAAIDTGVTAGKFIDDPTKLVIGCDSGSLQILSVSTGTSGKAPENHKFEGLGTLSEHNDMVAAIDNMGGGKARAVSCSLDKSIKVWDLDAMISEHTYWPAHARSVIDLSTQPAEGIKKHCNVFASCALDGSALLWDTRNSKPATGIQEANPVGLNSITWANDLDVILGGVNGKLSVLDIRNVAKPKTSFQLHSRPIHKMVPIPGCTGMVAACQDDTNVSVVKFSATEEPVTVFTNNRHDDFIRGLAWHPKSLTLWTCGWDSRVMCYSVPTGLAMNGNS